MISIRKQIEDSEGLVARFKALLNAFLGVAAVLPKTVAPASPEVCKRWKEALERTTAPLKDDAPAGVIDEVGRTAVGQIDEICRSNRAALDEFDSILKNVVDTAAVALSGFKSHGERHESSLTKLADGFDALSRVEDVAELRRRLRDDVVKLRRIGGGDAPRERGIGPPVRLPDYGLPAAHGAGPQRLRGRPAHPVGQPAGGRDVPAEDPQARRAGLRPAVRHRGLWGDQQRYGTPFGDKLLRALAHQLSDKFPEEGALFRWGADEFLVIAEGTLPKRLE